MLEKSNSYKNRCGKEKHIIFKLVSEIIHYTDTLTMTPPPLEKERCNQPLQIKESTVKVLNIIISNVYTIFHPDI